MPGGSGDVALQRFHDAQADCYATVLDELRAGRKRTHWMWFVFPQLAGLGHSATTQYYAIASLDEARAYLADPVLGVRLRDCARIVGDTNGRTIEQILGPVDALKLRSSMTLFHRADPAEPVFTRVLEKYYDGIPDDRTDALL